MWFVTFRKRGNGHPGVPEGDSVQETGHGPGAPHPLQGKATASVAGRGSARTGSRLRARAPCLPPLPSGWFQIPNGEQPDSLPGAARQRSWASALSPEHPCPSPPLPTSQMGCGLGSWLFGLGIT